MYVTINPSSFLDEMFWLFDCLQLGVASINFIKSSFASFADIVVSLLNVLNQTHKMEEHDCFASGIPNCSSNIASPYFDEALSQEVFISSWALIMPQ